MSLGTPCSRARGKSQGQRFIKVATSDTPGTGIESQRQRVAGTATHPVPSTSVSIANYPKWRAVPSETRAHVRSTAAWRSSTRVWSHLLLSKRCQLLPRRPLGEGVGYLPHLPSPCPARGGLSKAGLYSRSRSAQWRLRALVARPCAARTLATPRFGAHPRSPKPAGTSVSAPPPPSDKELPPQPHTAKSDSIGDTGDPPLQRCSARHRCTAERRTGVLGAFGAVFEPHIHPRNYFWDTCGGWWVLRTDGVEINTRYSIKHSML